MGPGPSGNYTQTPGFMTYLEVFDYLQLKGSAAHIHHTDSTAYAYSGLDWITYEDRSTVYFKCNYAELNGLNVGLQLLSQDVNTVVLYILDFDDLAYACRNAIPFPCVLGICL